ncbi:hypothetical protein [Amycolatopsis methanolica]|uniref:hypothetical protein n=1 Tax=Amycolatopsis methanolica TaxID=1814 RepID=UPI003432B71A
MTRTSPAPSATPAVPGTEIDRSACAADRHGTRAAYHHSRCRCPDAIAADHRYRHERASGQRQDELVPILGTRRRIRALQASGYPMDYLAAQLGITRNGAGRLAHLLKRGQLTVRRELAEQVTALYERLAGTPGPSRAMRTLARRAGHATPAQWGEADLRARGWPASTATAGSPRPERPSPRRRGTRSRRARGRQLA